MEDLIKDPVAVYAIIGLALLGADIGIIGLSPLMFVGGGALGMSGLLYISGWHPSLVDGLAAWAVVSLLTAIMGWRPLRRFQNANIQEDNNSDLVGRELVTTETVTKTGGWIEWSGTHWQVRLAPDVKDESIKVGIRARVEQVKDLVLVIRPIP